MQTILGRLTEVKVYIPNLPIIDVDMPDDTAIESVYIPNLPIIDVDRQTETFKPLSSTYLTFRLLM